MPHPRPSIQARIVSPRGYVAEVTPEVASAWLKRNVHNRRVRQENVDVLVRAIRAGQWQLDGNPVRFAADGTLLDGQHRLCAVIAADQTVPMFVVEGLDAAAQDVMDTGARRRAGDALTLADYPNANRLAAAVRLALTIDAQWKITTFANVEVLAWVADHPEMAEGIAYTKGTFRTSGLRPSVFDYTFWRLALIDATDAREFFARLSDGVGLPEGSPILALRRRLSGPYGKDRKISVNEQIAGVFRAWNACRTGEPLQRVVTISRLGDTQIPDPV